MGYDPVTSQKGERKRPTIAEWIAMWIAIIISLAAVGVAIYGVHRTSQVQEQANNIAQENVRVSKENITLQKQLQAQSQAAQARAAAQSVAITTDPPEIFAGTSGVQGVVVNNGAREPIVDVEVVFRNTMGGIMAVANIPVINACDTVKLDFDIYTPSENYDAWLYFEDPNDNIWQTDLFGHFSEVEQEPTGPDVSDELLATAGTMPPGTCGQ